MCIATLLVTNSAPNLDAVERLLARLRVALRPNIEARTMALAVVAAASADVEPAR
jgi:hypothetical protein